MEQVSPAIAVPCFLFFCVSPIAPNNIPNIDNGRPKPKQHANNKPVIPKIIAAIPKPLSSKLSICYFLPLSYVY